MSIVMSLIITLGLVCINTSQASAYVAACPSSSIGGRHDMKASGQGNVLVNGVYAVRYGYAYQCKGCKDVMVTETDAVMTGNIGKYAEFNPGYWISKYGVTIQAARTYTAGTSISGYRFSY